MQAALPIASGLSGQEKAALWAAADKLRGHLDAAEYKHVVLGQLAGAAPTLRGLFNHLA